MSKIVAIEVTDVFKTFKRHSEPASTLKERLISLHKSEVKTFNALTDINFEVAVGESVGILGHNGSGKSTLLKTIAGTLRPSKGTVKVRGALAALLELGAGFHPDLTGKENIYLNGSVLGFSKEDIDKIFDQIVDFAELEEFIHTQVKHYSSGMYARLGFAVAINLQPDVLLVDEVLAVGDEAFQRKCIARINQFQQQGKTLMLVTHSPEQVVDICDRAIVLDHGNMLYAGDVHEAALVYRRSIHGESYSELNLTEGSESHCITVKKATVTSTSGENIVEADEALAIRLQLNVGFAVEGDARVLIHDHEGAEMVNLSSQILLGKTLAFDAGDNELVLEVEKLSLATGVYTISFVMGDTSSPTAYARVEKITKFTVQNKAADTGRVAVNAKIVQRQLV